MSLSYLACCNPDTNVRERNFATRGWYFGCVPVAAESSLDELPDSSEEVGTIDVAYEPGEVITGLGRIVELVQALAHRFQIQEFLVRDIAETIKERVGAKAASWSEEG